MYRAVQTAHTAQKARHMMGLKSANRADRGRLIQYCTTLHQVAGGGESVTSRSGRLTPPQGDTSRCPSGRPHSSSRYDRARTRSTSANRTPDPNPQCPVYNTATHISPAKLEPRTSQFSDALLPRTVTLQATPEQTKNKDGRNVNLIFHLTWCENVRGVTSFSLHWGNLYCYNPVDFNKSQ